MVTGRFSIHPVKSFPYLQRHSPRFRIRRTDASHLLWRFDRRQRNLHWRFRYWNNWNEQILFVLFDMYMKYIASKRDSISPCSPLICGGWSSGWTECSSEPNPLTRASCLGLSSLPSGFNHTLPPSSRRRGTALGLPPTGDDFSAPETHQRRLLSSFFSLVLLSIHAKKITKVLGEYVPLQKIIGSVLFFKSPILVKRNF